MLRYKSLLKSGLAVHHVRFVRQRPFRNDHIGTSTTSSIVGNTPKIVDRVAPNVEAAEKDLQSMGFKELKHNDDNLDDESLVDWLTVNNSGFKNSTSNLRNLVAKLKTVPQQSAERVKLTFSYLLKEVEMEIERLNLFSPETLNEMLLANKQRALKNAIKSEDIGKIFFQELVSMDNGKHVSPLQHTELLLNILVEINKSKEKGITIEQAVEAFELSKLIPDYETRLRAITLSGRLLYSFGKVRMDAVNESFYIEGLLHHGYDKQALHYFESYKDKVNQKWWNEVGLMIMLRSNQLQRFDTLFKQTVQKYGETNIRPKIIKTAIKKKLQSKTFAEADYFNDLFLRLVDTHGCIKEKQNNQPTMMDFESEEHANEYFNAIEVPTHADFMSIIAANFFRGNQPMAYKLLARLIQSPNFDIENWTDCIWMMRLPLLRDFSSFEIAIKPFLEHETEAETLRQLQKSFDLVIESKGLTKIRKALDSVLFSNMESFAANSEMSKLLYDYMIKYWTKSDHELDSSKKFHGIFKILLATNQEKTAKEILTKLEQSENDSVFPKVNAHHYAAFVDYYRILAARAKTGPKKNMLNEQVDNIIKSMERLGVSHNSEILASLISYYRTVYDFNKCFALINSILGSKIEMHTADSKELNLRSFYDRRTITLKLYLEIWNAYRSYQKVFKRDSHSIEQTSNARDWKYQVIHIRKNTSTHPEFSMLQLFKMMVKVDNILISSDIYNTILQTLASGYDWTTIPAVLEYMQKIHNVPCSKKLSSYLTVSLTRAYVDMERRKLFFSGGISATNSKINAAKRKVMNMVKEGEILEDKETNDAICNLILHIKDLLSKTEPSKVPEIEEAYKELGLMPPPM
ncbi:HDR161Wp [Eremothecium sinecaudum]|uniref:HDR161Wp n=1 Tax=Eremothecium sinecaudum TaxID=45286 RepID=A0A0X8HT36_9SACH|nr:HDR161Wp [Eremothecium sinecaudum]AMD20903.1 HDR161Wp [Eremothecium sinecaudum]